MRGKPQVTTRTRVSVPPQGAARLFRGRCRIQRGAPIAGPRRLPSRVRAASLRSFIGDAVGPLAQADSENEMTTVVLRSDNATCTAITGLCSGCARIRRIWNFGILQTKNWASWPTSRRRGSTNRTRRLPRVPGAVCLRRSGHSVVQQHWPRRGNWSADDWHLDLAVLEDGQIVGLQNLAARDYAIVGKASTFSWLGLRHRAGASAPRGVPRACTWPSPESMRLKRPREHSTTTPHP